jgi:cytochrome c553
VCGAQENLQVHHKQLRSQQGSDEDSNLITLCAACHEGMHVATLRIQLMR